MQGSEPAHTLPVLQQKDPIAFLQVTDIAMGLVRCCVTCLSRTEEYTLSVKQGKIFSHKLKSPALAMRKKVFGEEVFWSQGPFLCD